MPKLKKKKKRSVETTPAETVSREQLIQTLEFVSPGLATREIIQQSNCFVFTPGLVQTYNEEIACSAESPLQLTGAIASAPLMSLLSKLPEEEIKVSIEGSHFCVEGKRRYAGVVLEKEVTLPVEDVERPKKWKDLPDHFIDAIKLASVCVSTNASQRVLMCVHIHPKWIEACDRNQILRYRLKTDVSSPVLVQGQSLKHIVDLGADQFCETSKWLHFKNGGGLVISLRRLVNDEYMNLSQFLAGEGEKVVLPKGLMTAAETVDIFVSDNEDEKQHAKITLEDGVLWIEGSGTSGWYRERKKVKYTGRPMTFLISPSLLKQIVDRYNECEVMKGKLKVRGDKWVYVSSLAEEGAGNVEPDEEAEDVEEVLDASED